MCAWACEVLADRVCRRNPGETCKTAGLSGDYRLYTAEQLATSFSLTSVVGHSDGKGDPCVIREQMTAITDWHWKTHSPSFLSLLAKSCVLQSCRWSQTAGKMEETEWADRGKKRVKNWVFLEKKRFQHESGAASHRISLGIDWRRRAYQYSTREPPAQKYVHGSLCMDDKTSPNHKWNQQSVFSHLSCWHQRQFYCIRAVRDDHFYVQSQIKVSPSPALCG